MNISSIIKTDILVIGGGIAGLMAAIRAADKGADVLIAEKAHVLRGGSGATGNDHFSAMFPSCMATSAWPSGKSPTARPPCAAKDA